MNSFRMMDEKPASERLSSSILKLKQEVDKSLKMVMQSQMPVIKNDFIMCGDATPPRLTSNIFRNSELTQTTVAEHFDVQIKRHGQTQYVPMISQDRQPEQEIQVVQIAEHPSEEEHNHSDVNVSEEDGKMDRASSFNSRTDGENQQKMKVVLNNTPFDSPNLSNNN